MKRNKPNLARRIKQKGAVAVEYMILLVFLSLLIAVGANQLGMTINSKFSNLADTITAATVPTLPPNTGG